MKNGWRVTSLNKEGEIAGIWRFSDDKKFYIGDKTKYGPIAKFAISDDQVLVFIGDSPIYGIKELSHSRIYYLDEVL